MLKLKSAEAGPFWLDLMPDVRVRVRPITPTMILVARDEAGKMLRASVELSEAGATVADGLAKLSETSTIEAGVVVTRRLAHLGIVEWEGVGDADGNPLPVTAANVDLALDVWPIFDAIDRLYVDPTFVREAEKNVSTNSLSGTSSPAAAPNTATPAAPSAPNAPTART